MVVGCVPLKTTKKKTRVKVARLEDFKRNLSGNDGNRIDGESGSRTRAFSF